MLFNIGGLGTASDEGGLYFRETGSLPVPTDESIVLASDPILAQRSHMSVPSTIQCHCEVTIVVGGYGVMGG